MLIELPRAAGLKTVNLRGKAANAFVLMVCRNS